MHSLIEYKLKFNYKDLFLSPRLALSPKKIWINLIGNLAGFISYWFLSYLAIFISNNDVILIMSEYGLFPYLYGENISILSKIIYYFGISIWIFFLCLSNMATSRLTLKQLTGDNFYSINDANNFINKNWKTVLFGLISIILIIFIFFVFAILFSFFTKIPIIGTLSFPLFFILYFFGAIFLIFTTLVLFISFFFIPIIIGVSNEDTTGAVFQSYQILFTQPWRILLYNSLLFPIAFFFTNIISWLATSSFNLINITFSYFGNERLQNIFNYSTNIVDLSWINNYSSIIININENTLKNTNLGSDILYFIHMILNKSFFLIINSLPKFQINYSSESFTSLEVISGILLSIPIILIILSVLSYGFTILSVGHTISFIIFEKLNKDEDLISHIDEDLISHIDND